MISLSYQYPTIFLILLNISQHLLYLTKYFLISNWLTTYYLKFVVKMLWTFISLFIMFIVFYPLHIINVEGNKERERERDIYIYIYIYFWWIAIKIHIYRCCHSHLLVWTHEALHLFRQREREKWIVSYLLQRLWIKWVSLYVLLSSFIAEYHYMKFLNACIVMDFLVNMLTWALTNIFVNARVKMFVWPY